MSVWLGITLIFVGIVVLIVQHGRTIGGMENEDFAQLIAGLSILIILGGGLIATYFDKVGKTLKIIGVWSLVFLLLIAAYAYRYELIGATERVVGALLPDGAQTEFDDPESIGGAVRIKRERGGQFVANALVNGAKTRMIVDTGASAVVLRPEDAVRAGIDVRDLRYSVPVQTANGQTFAARVRINSITVGGIRIRDVDALITRPGMLHQSLLGMSFLSRLRSYEFTGDFLVMRS